MITASEHIQCLQSMSFQAPPTALQGEKFDSEGQLIQFHI